MVDSIGAVNAGFCDACLTGNYPIEIPVNLSKNVLESGEERHSESTIAKSIEGDRETTANDTLFS